MNERIRELSGQAWLHARAIYGDYLTDSGKANHAFFDTFDKKFAELIVRECAQVCAKIELDEELSAEADIWDGAMMCRVEIKQHFGVEE